MHAAQVSIAFCHLRTYVFYSSGNAFAGLIAGPRQGKLSGPKSEVTSPTIKRHISKLGKRVSDPGCGAAQSCSVRLTCCARKMGESLLILFSAHPAAGYVRPHASPANTRKRHRRPTPLTSIPCHPKALLRSPKVRRGESPTKPPPTR